MTSNIVICSKVMVIFHITLLLYNSHEITHFKQEQDLKRKIKLLLYPSFPETNIMTADDVLYSFYSTLHSTFHHLFPTRSRTERGNQTAAFQILILNKHLGFRCCYVVLIVPLIYFTYHFPSLISNKSRIKKENHLLLSKS